MTSCQQAKNTLPSMASGVVMLNYGGVEMPTWCEVVSANEVWNLIMKIDGNQQTFTFSAAYWSNQVSYNDASVKYGLSSTNGEYKSPLYWQMPFNYVRVGFLGSRTGNTLNWGYFGYTGNSLYAQIADGAYRGINFDRNAWKSVVGNGSLQPNCNRSGFNSNSDAGNNGVRLGILGNNEGECLSPDSRIGFGGFGNYCGCDTTNSCGMETFCGGDNGDGIHYKAFGYIMIR